VGDPYPRRIGLHTVAIHTDLDASAQHVRDADAALTVPSHLDVDVMDATAAPSRAGLDRRDGLLCVCPCRSPA
jgi:biotin carboxylase